MPGYTHVVIITADDLTTTATNTAQAFTVALKTGDQILRMAWYLITPFQNTGDAAFNSDTISLGDNASATTHLSAAEANANGTYVTWRTGNTVVLYTAADTFKITVNSMTGKALNNINRGELRIFVAICRIKNVSDAMPAVSISKT